MDPDAQAAAAVGYKVGLVVGALFVGALVGLIPLTMGRKRDDNIVGTVGMVACMGGAYISGILGAFSMAIGFAVAILVSGRRA